MKKILAALLAGIVFTVSGCSLVFPATTESGQDKTSTVSPSVNYSSEYLGNWCYQRLDSRLKLCYGEVYTAVREGFDSDETVTISDSTLGTDRQYPGLKIELTQPLTNRADALTLYTAFLTDNPGFFYISNNYSFEGYRSGNVDYYNVFILAFSMNAEERAEASQKLEQVIAALLRNVDKTDSDFSREIKLHDGLAKLCTYESAAEACADPISVYPMAFTAYGALVEGRAVCEGYSRAMQLLLHRVGMECTLVNGSADNGISHMWNLVTVNNRNYHLDVTWDDSSDLLQHTYFNLTTEDILLTHTVDSDNMGVDTCTAGEDNYFNHEGLYLSTAKRDDIAQIIAGYVRQGKTKIELRFTKSTFASARLFINNREMLAERVNSYLTDCSMKMWDYEEYAIDETYCTISL